MSCIILRNPVGINPDCIKFLESAENIILWTSGQSFPNRGSFRSQESHRVKIQQELSEFIPVGLKGYESTPGEVIKETSDFDNSSQVTTEGPPSIILDIKTNPLDWNEQMAQLKGGGYRIGFIMKKTGDVFISVSPAGVVKGFIGNVFAQAVTLRAQGESFQTYKLMIDFQDVNEFRNFDLIDMPFNPTVELVSKMPLGLTMRTAGAYAVSDINVTVTERDGTPYTGTLTVEEIESYDSITGLPIDSFSSSVVNNTGGSYTLTLEKDAVPVTLVAGDFVTIRVATKTVDVYNYVSGELTVNP